MQFTDHWWWPWTSIYQIKRLGLVRTPWMHTMCVPAWPLSCTIHSGLCEINGKWTQWGRSSFRAKLLCTTEVQPKIKAHLWSYAICVDIRRISSFQRNLHCFIMTLTKVVSALIICSAQPSILLEWALWHISVYPPHFHIRCSTQLLILDDMPAILFSFRIFRLAVWCFSLHHHWSLIGVLT